jgi:hypothetical protein
MNDNTEQLDEITRLRLRLSVVELQRDAYASALRKEVRMVIEEVLRDVLTLPPE